MRGSTSDPNTNRCGKIYFTDNNDFVIEFWINIKHKYKTVISGKDLSRNERKILEKLVSKINIKEGYFNLGFDLHDIYISYDLIVVANKDYKGIIHRILGIDLNPNYIACAIIDYNTNEILYEWIYDVKKLVKARQATKCDKEYSEIALDIVRMATHYSCEGISLETLNTFKQGQRRQLNEWNRKNVHDSIVKWGILSGLKVMHINPAYTSFNGQLKFQDKCDSIATAIEIAWRYYMKQIGYSDKEVIDSVKNRVILIGDLTIRWKKKLTQLKDITSMKLIELYDYLKQKKVGLYRVRLLFPEIKDRFKTFSLKSEKSLCYIHVEKNAGIC